LQVDGVNGDLYAVTVATPAVTVTIHKTSNVCSAPNWVTIDTTSIFTQYFAQLAVKSGRVYLATSGGTYGNVWRRDPSSGAWTSIASQIPQSQRGTLRLWIHPRATPYDTLFYSSAEHLYRTTNATATPVAWTDITANQLSSNTIANNAAASVAVDPLNGSTIYAGLLQPTSDATDGPASGLDNLYKSTDGGSTWSVLNFTWETNTLSIKQRASILNSITLIAGTFSNGIVRSTNSGQNWAPAAQTPTGGRVNRVLFHPNSSYNVQAFSAVQSPSPIASGVVCALPSQTSPGGVYKSADSGNSWTQVLGPPSSPPACPIGVCFAYFSDVVIPDPTNNPQTILAAGWNTSCTLDPGGNPSETLIQGGVWSSTDGGTNWTNLGPLVQGYSVAQDPTNNLYCGTIGAGVPAPSPALYKRINGGSTWTGIGGSWYGVVSSILVRNRTPVDILLTINTGDTAPSNLLTPSPGLYRSTDGGGTWSEISASSVYPTLNYYWSLLDPTNSSNVYIPVYGGSLWKASIP
jgi:hypothetical protein